MKDDDKTVEIIIPTPVKPQIQTSKSSLPHAAIVGEKHTPQFTATQTGNLALNLTWTDVLKRELSQDWTLRLLALVTLLALSLLVL